MSLRARSRWTWRRASSPVIHFDSPEGSAILPSIDSASFSVIRGRPSLSRVSQPPSEQRSVYAWQTSIGVAVLGTAAAVVLIVLFTYMDDYIGSFWSQVIYFLAFFGVVIGLAERSRRMDRRQPTRLTDASQPVTPAGLPGPFVATQAFGVLGVTMIGAR